MLIEFTVGNFRSIRDPIIFSMAAASIHSKTKSLDEANTFLTPQNERLVKSAAIYGANGSGKSNLIRALRFMKRLVDTSARVIGPEDETGTEPFLLESTFSHHPSMFEAIFVANERQYRYGFELTSEAITHEWLYHVPGEREAMLFDRTFNQFEMSGVFSEGQGLQSKTRPNALFLSVVAQFNGEISKVVARWFGSMDIVSGLADMTGMRRTQKMLDDPTARQAITDLLRGLDLGFEDIRLEVVEGDDSARPPYTGSGTLVERLRSPASRGDESRATWRARSIKTIHRQNENGEPIEFNLNEQESAGTQKLFALVGLVVDALRKGTLLIVDEIEGRLHTLLTQALLKLFNSSSTNPKNAQLIVATHDTNLLSHEIFRRDQIWFTEKDSDQSTRLHSLVEYRIRNDERYERNYIRGKYGGIPFTGDLALLPGIESPEGESDVEA